MLAWPSRLKALNVIVHPHLIWPNSNIFDQRFPTLLDQGNSEIAPDGLFFEDGSMLEASPLKLDGVEKHEHIRKDNFG